MGVASYYVDVELKHGKRMCWRESTDNRQRFVGLYLDNGLLITGTIFQQKTRHNLAWISPSGKATQAYMVPGGDCSQKVIQREEHHLEEDCSEGVTSKEIRRHTGIDNMMEEVTQATKVNGPRPVDGQDQAATRCPQMDTTWRRRNSFRVDLNKSVLRMEMFSRKDVCVFL